MQPFRLHEDAPVGVLANPSGDCGPEILRIRAWAEGLGLGIVDLGTSADSTDVPAGCELVIALGGDGTILRALHVAMAHEAAVLGINFGHVGFLADTEGDDLAAALDRVAGGEARVDERTALAATLGDREVIAFNDVVIGRVPGFGTARLRVEIDGRQVLTPSGDGLVIASPTGSTAYTLGAGGPAVAPTLEAIVLTPLASQGSPLRSLVVDGDDAVRITSDRVSAPVSLEVDGRNVMELEPSAAIEVRAAARKARLVRTRPRTFYGDLAERI